MEQDVAYFSRRASEERAAASLAEHPNAKQAHLELAERYQEMAAAIDSSDPSRRHGENNEIKLSA